MPIKDIIKVLFRKFIIKKIAKKILPKIVVNTVFKNQFAFIVLHLSDKISLSVSLKFLS